MAWSNVLWSMKRTRNSKRRSHDWPQALPCMSNTAQVVKTAVVKPRPTDGISEQVELVPNV